MEYTINKLAKMAGVSARTLRYYDQCGLLVPVRISNGYRIYGQNEIDRLQQILFYRELDVPMEKIKSILTDENFNPLDALICHLHALCGKRDQLDRLITNVEKSINSMKGNITMADKEKFEGFKQSMIDSNEKQYGEEIRGKYGNETVDQSNARLKSMTQEQYAELEQLNHELNEAIKTAFEQGDPASEAAQKMCGLHKQWLCFYWSSYSKEAHIGVSQMYVDDPRFTAYYDKIVPGSAPFLRDAVLIYCS